MTSKKVAWVFPVAVAAASLLALGPTVVSCSPSCEDLDNCGPYVPPPGGGTSGDGGAPDGAGTSGAGTSGKTGNGGAGVGGKSIGGGGGGAPDAGAGGTPLTKPCDGACSGAKPVCEESTDTCVECLEPIDCTGTKKLCDTATTACVDCLAPTDCTDPKAARCDAKACAPCQSNDDCAHIAGKTVCDAVAGECVQCTGSDYSACGQSMGTPVVCDTLKRKCSTSKEKSAGLCQACVSDAQCATGELCVKQTFGTPAKDVGYFCFYKQGAPSAPTDCVATGSPYVKVLPNQTSIDGASAKICGLAVSTCTARNQFRSKDCTTSMAPDDTKCGFDPGKDSKCQAFGASQFVCTMTCGSTRDCPNGFACNTGVNPAACEL